MLSTLDGDHEFLGLRGFGVDTSTPGPAADATTTGSDAWDEWFSGTILDGLRIASRGRPFWPMALASGPTIVKEHEQ